MAAFASRRWQLTNTKAGHRKLIQLLKKLAAKSNQPIQVICEATGPYHLAMCLALQDAGIAFSVVNPARVHHFGLGKGVLAKNDPADAELIEQFGNDQQPGADPELCMEKIGERESGLES